MFPTSNRKTSKKYPRLRAVWAGIFTDILGFFIILPFIPTFMKIYDVSPLMIGLLMATNALFTFLSAPIWGKASDRVGRKPLLIICQGGTIMAFLILAFSNSLELLFISRIVDGIFGGNFTLVKSIISDEVPPQDRGLQMTNVGVVVILAGLIGPGVGGLLSVYGIMGPGLAAAGMSTITLIITIFYLKESWPKSKRLKKLDINKVKIKLRKNKTAMYMLTLWGFHTLTFMMFLITIALIMVMVLNLNAFEIGILLTIAGIFRAIIRFTLFKRLLKFLGEKNMLKLGLAFFVLTFIFIGFVENVVGFVILILFFSFGASCARGPLISKVTLSVTPREMGKINGVTSALDSLAAIVGPLIAGFLIGLYGPWWLALFMAIVAVVTFFMNLKKIELFDFSNMKSGFQKE